jgi:preprotein translocase subunit SecE
MSHGVREHVLMAKFNPFEFIQEVRQEVSKVTWPTWKEVWITTLMVLVMVTLASIFFLGVDQVLGRVINLVLGIGR